MKSTAGVWIPPEWSETFDNLTDAAAAELIRTALAFASGDDRAPSDPVVAALWPLLRSVIAHQIERRAAQSAQAQAAVAKRWERAKAAPQVEAVPAAPSAETAAEAPRQTVRLKPLRPQEAALRAAVGSYYHRKPSTAWSRRETTLAAAVAKRPDVAAETAEILKFYRSGYAYARRDVATLLNNWQGELDRARQSTTAAAQSGAAIYQGAF